MLVAGTDLPLPYYAEPSLANQNLTSVGSVALGTAYDYAVGKGMIEVPMLIFATFTTSATVSNRAVFVTIFDSSNAAVIRVTAGATQPQSTINTYSFISGLPSALGPIGRTQQAGFAPVVMMPGWSFSMNVNNLDAGDQFSSIGVTVIRIPTGVGLGDPRAPVPPPLAAIPLQL